MLHRIRQGTRSRKHHLGPIPSRARLESCFHLLEEKNGKKHEEARLAEKAAARGSGDELPRLVCIVTGGWHVDVPATGIKEVKLKQNKCSRNRKLKQMKCNESPDN